MMGHDHQVQEILTAEIWDEVSLNLLAKMIAEFLYEEIIKPEVVEEKDERTSYHLPLAKKDGKEVHYRFEAKKRLMDSYRVYPESIQVNRDDKWGKST